VDTDGDKLMTPGEVAEIYRVNPKTVTRWAAAGRLTAVRTPGGHRRFWESEIRALVANNTTAATAEYRHAVRPPLPS